MKAALLILAFLPLLASAQSIDFSRAVHHAAAPLFVTSPTSLTLVGAFGSGGTAVILTPTYTGATKSFTVTGNYEVSLDGGTTYVTSGTVPATGTALKVRTTAANPSGSGSGSVNFTGADISTVTVTISSTENGTLSASPTSATTNSTSGTAGSATTITVTFAGNTVTATPPSGTEFSKDGGSTYSTSAQTFSSGSPLTTKIRAAAGDAAGAISGNLVLSEPGATTVNVAVTGTVSSSATTPDSVIVYLDTTTGSLGGNSIELKGDPSAHSGTGHVLTGSLSGTTYSATTVSTSSANWNYNSNTGNNGCMFPSDGITNAVWPAGWTGAMKEGAFTTNLYGTTNAQLIVSGFKTDGTTYDVMIGATSQYNQATGGEYNVKGASLQTAQFATANLSGTANGLSGSSPLIFSFVQPDGSGNITIYFGLKDVGQTFAMLNFVKFNKN